MRLSLMSFAACGLALLPVAAKADTFNFSATGSGFSASGVLNATNNGNGSFTITSVSGSGIGGLVTSPFFPSDNLLFPGASRLLDVLGFGFTDTIGGTAYTVNLYSDNSPSGFSYFADVYDATGNLTNEATVKFIAATPEPSSMVLLGTGMAAMLGFAMRKRLTV